MPRGELELVRAEDVCVGQRVRIPNSVGKDLATVISVHPTLSHLVVDTDLGPFALGYRRSILAEAS